MSNSTPFDNVYERLNLFRQHGESDDAFAERLGISVKRLEQWRRGKVLHPWNDPDLERAALNLSVDFFRLLFGHGQTAWYVDGRLTPDGTEENMTLFVPKAFHVIRVPLAGA